MRVGFVFVVTVIFFGGSTGERDREPELDEGGKKAIGSSLGEPIPPEKALLPKLPLLPELPVLPKLPLLPERPVPPAEPTGLPMRQQHQAQIKGVVVLLDDKKPIPPINPPKDHIMGYDHEKLSSLEVSAGRDAVPPQKQHGYFEGSDVLLENKLGTEFREGTQISSGQGQLFGTINVTEHKSHYSGSDKAEESLFDRDNQEKQGTSEYYYDDSRRVISGNVFNESLSRGTERLISSNQKSQSTYTETVALPERQGAIELPQGSPPVQRNEVPSDDKQQPHPTEGKKNYERNDHEKHSSLEIAAVRDTLPPQKEHGYFEGSNVLLENKLGTEFREATQISSGQGQPFGTINVTEPKSSHYSGSGKADKSLFDRDSQEKLGASEYYYDDRHRVISGSEYNESLSRGTERLISSNQQSQSTFTETEVLPERKGSIELPKETPPVQGNEVPSGDKIQQNAKQQNDYERYGYETHSSLKIPVELDPAMPRQKKTEHFEYSDVHSENIAGGEFPAAPQNYRPSGAIKATQHISRYSGGGKAEEPLLESNTQKQQGTSRHPCVDRIVSEYECDGTEHLLESSSNVDERISTETEVLPERNGAIELPYGTPIRGMRDPSGDKNQRHSIKSQNDYRGYDGERGSSFEIPSRPDIAMPPQQISGYSEEYKERILQNKKRETAGHSEKKGAKYDDWFLQSYCYERLEKQVEAAEEYERTDVFRRPQHVRSGQYRQFWTKSSNFMDDLHCRCTCRPRSMSYQKKEDEPSDHMVWRDMYTKGNPVDRNTIFQDDLWTTKGGVNEMLDSRPTSRSTGQKN